MTPDQALKFITQVTSQIQATRDAHNQIVQALQVISAALESKEKQASK